MGGVKPKIFFPKTLSSFTPSQVKHVLEHEMFHIKRLDCVWKLLSVVALCLYWYNPAVWLMCILMSRDMELSCDEAVIRNLDKTRRAAYAMSIIEIAERQINIIPIYSGFSKTATEERIEAIMKFKKKSVVAIVLSAALIVCTASAFAASTNAEPGTPLAALAEKFGISTANKTDEQIKMEIGDAMGANEDIVRGEPDADAITLENAIVAVKSVLAQDYGVSMSLIEQYCYYEIYNVSDVDAPQWIIDVTAEGNPEIWDANDGRFIVTLDAKTGDILDVNHIVYPKLEAKGNSDEQTVPADRAALSEKLGIDVTGMSDDEIKEIIAKVGASVGIVSGEPDTDAITLENAIIAVKSVLAQDYGVSQSLLEQYCYYDTYNVSNVDAPQWIIDVTAEGNPKIWDENDGRFIVTLKATNGDVLDVKHIVYPKLQAQDNPGNK
jgi:hypothetical protein